jgi:2-dehydro-3-deoxy-D-arabinonate dehydratase
MKLYRTAQAVFVEKAGKFYPVPAQSWDELLSSGNIHARAAAATSGKHETFEQSALLATALAPIQNQEVWAAGVTYYRSRNARMRESKDAGGGDFYSRVYDAPRPELFFKATGRRVVGSGANVRIRADSKWNVAEPELTLVIDPSGKIVGYTIGNDMSSRDIEGENPLYLPQAKIYDGSCALGPCVLLATEPLSEYTTIYLEILRGRESAFTGSTTLASLKRDPKELVEFLFRDNSFPDGAFLMTGTGVVPADDFTLHSGDRIRISIDGIGTLENCVA